MHQQGGAVFRMDPRTVFLGALIVFASIIFVVTALPYLTFNPPQSADARPLTDRKKEVVCSMRPTVASTATPSTCGRRTGPV